MSSIIVDHAHSPAKRSLGNQERYRRRMHDRIKDAVNQQANQGNLSDMDKTKTIRVKHLKQPNFSNDQSTGHNRVVVPGNPEFTPGDQLPKPQGKQSGGGAGDGDSEDDFLFEIPPAMVQELLLADLELPDLLKKQLTDLSTPAWQRAGYQSDGNISQLALGVSARRALARRIALKRPHRKELRRLEERLADLEAQEFRSPEQESEREEVKRRIAVIKRKRQVIPFMQETDLRYRRFEKTPKPVTQAEMFCLMDVSASMGEHHKDLARRFFYLLNLFLHRNYQSVKVVFIRHTHVADEVDEHTFFYGQETGGTRVLPALEKMADIIHERYPASDWNIYACQASDGDALSTDAVECPAYLEEVLLPLCQYFAYLEVYKVNARQTHLWQAYEDITAPHFAMTTACERNQIWPVFAELFTKKRQAA